GIHQIRWNDPAMAFAVITPWRGRLHEIGAFIRGVVWIVDRNVKLPLSPGSLRHAANLNGARVVAQFLVVAKDEGLVLPDRPTERTAELVTQVEWSCSIRAVSEEIIGIQMIIAVKLVRRAMNLICAGFNHRIDYGSRAATELGGIAVRLDLEFLKRV